MLLMTVLTRLYRNLPQIYNEMHQSDGGYYNLAENCMEGCHLCPEVLRTTELSSF